MAKKQDLFPNWSVTFQMEVDEDAKAFFERTLKEHESLEKAAKERIRQLFDEYVSLDGKEKDKAFFQLLHLFSIGYQLGWNDCHRINEEK